MDKFKQILKTILDNLGFLSENEKLSITNLAVIVFLTITAFRSLFGGLELTIKDIHWVVQTVSYPDALPLLFSLWNYNEKRKQNNTLATAVTKDSQ